MAGAPMTRGIKPSVGTRSCGVSPITPNKAGSSLPRSASEARKIARQPAAVAPTMSFLNVSPTCTHVEGETSSAERPARSRARSKMLAHGFSWPWACEVMMKSNRSAIPSDASKPGRRSSKLDITPSFSSPTGSWARQRAICCTTPADASISSQLAELPKSLYSAPNTEGISRSTTVWRTPACTKVLLTTVDHQSRLEMRPEPKHLSSAHCALYATPKPSAMAAGSTSNAASSSASSGEPRISLRALRLLISASR
mmetsp:Transcript_26599/g.67410  ORF Transcript_26599/g.67410 Transcript_26599/m.67410 type:complete len:255 (-) Transcript_26599:145-909(-)